MALPLCSSFVPTILEGQRCYKLELKELSDKGKRNELMLLLDYNDDLSLRTSPKREGSGDVAKENINFDTDVESLQRVSAKIHINTLSPYTGFGGGIYSMTGVKRMTASSDFLRMPWKDRNCEVESYDDCRTRKLLEQCNCVPWLVPGFQVRCLR